MKVVSSTFLILSLVVVAVSASATEDNEIHHLHRLRQIRRRRATTDRGDLSLSVINVDGLEEVDGAEKKLKINAADIDAAFEEETGNGVHLERMLQTSMSMRMRMLLTQPQTQLKEEAVEEVVLEESQQSKNNIDIDAAFIEEVDIYGGQRELQSMSMRMRELQSSMSM